MPKRAHRRIAVSTGGQVIRLPSVLTPTPVTYSQPAVSVSKPARRQAKQAAAESRRAAEAQRLALTRAYQSQERAARREFKLAPAREKQAFILEKRAGSQALKLALPGQKQQFILAKQGQKQTARLVSRQAAAAAAMDALRMQDFPAAAPAPAAALPPEATLLPATEPAALTELEPEDSFEFEEDSGFEEPDEFEQEATWADELDTESPQEVDETPFERINSGGFDDVEADEGFEPLEGLGFSIVDSVTAKWNELVAWMQAQVGRFLQIKSEILNQQKVLDEAIRKAKAGGGDVHHLKDLRSRANEALSDQKDLEGQVLEQMQKISATKSQPGVGVLPIVIGAAAVSVLAYVAGKVYLQMRSWDQLNKEIDLATRGVMSVTDIERLKKANTLDPFGLGNLKTLALVALGIFVVWKLVPMITKRQAA